MLSILSEPSSTFYQPPRNGIQVHPCIIIPRSCANGRLTPFAIMGPKFLRDYPKLYTDHQRQRALAEVPSTIYAFNVKGLENVRSETIP